jgi:hypothetical protein
MEGWIEQPDPASAAIEIAVEDGRQQLRRLHAETPDKTGEGTKTQRYGQAMAKKKPNTRIVSPNPEGGWDVQKPGAKRASAHLDRQGDADERAAEILRNEGGGERITQGRDGKIPSKDTIAPGNDPFPPRDREH